MKHIPRNGTRPICNGNAATLNDFFFVTTKRSALTRVMYDSHSFVCLVVTPVASLPPPLSPHLNQYSYINLSPQVLYSRNSHDKFLGFASGQQTYKAFKFFHKEEDYIWLESKQSGWDMASVNRVKNTLQCYFLSLCI